MWIIWSRCSDTGKWRPEEDLVSSRVAEPDAFFILMGLRQWLSGSQACSKINPFCGLSKNINLILLSYIVCFNLYWDIFSWSFKKTEWLVLRNNSNHTWQFQSSKWESHKSCICTYSFSSKQSPKDQLKPHSFKIDKTCVIISFNLPKISNKQGLSTMSRQWHTN